METLVDTDSRWMTRPSGSCVTPRIITIPPFEFRLGLAHCVRRARGDELSLESRSKAVWRIRARHHGTQADYAEPKARGVRTSEGNRCELRLLDSRTTARPSD